MSSQGDEEARPRPSIEKFFEEHDVKLLRVLTDRGSEYCGNPERHEYELYLAFEDIDHSRTKTKSPRFHIAKGVSFIRFMSTSNSALSQTEMTTIVFSAHTRRACPSFSIILREVGVRGFNT